MLTYASDTKFGPFVSKFAKKIKYLCRLVPKISLASRKFKHLTPLPPETTLKITDVTCSQTILAQKSNRI